MYGPHFPLHTEKYLRVRVLAKLMDDQLPMFRFFSCKFKLEKSKMKTARIVMFKEFGIMNSFTVESSMHGYMCDGETRSERYIEVINLKHLDQMGKGLGNSLIEYNNLVEDDFSKQKEMIKRQRHRKRSAFDVLCQPKKVITDKSQSMKVTKQNLEEVLKQI